jgi:hypothetical protein
MSETTPSVSETTTEKSDALRATFLRDGFLCQRQALPENALSDWQSLAPAHWTSTFQALHDHGHTPFPTESILDADTTGKQQYALGQGVKHGFREIVRRSPGRYELPLLNNARLQESVDTSTWLARLQDHLGSTVPSLLGKTSWDEVKIVNVSFVVSTPGASDQGWHADGGHLSLDTHLPCHCLNIFLALHAMPSADWGPTQVRPGSHVYTRNLAPLLLAARCRHTLRPPVAPLLQPGDVLIFDYRLLHRGLANQTKDQNRSLLVLTVSEPWFEDRLNFPKRSLYEKKAVVPSAGLGE